ncbi:peptidylprolyl isomerase [Vagococcus sp.]|uniref:peptidylprolyl isomerase n=1 Tax=Vagococcus sp. TaxID=1933889 RepID=UPI003F9D3B09
MTDFPQLALEEATTFATLHTTLGDIKIALFPEKAPKTVENFIGLAEKNYYDGVIFHRVIPDFMIQGGDPTGTGMGGTSIYGNKFADEFSRELFNIRGALSMANAGPNTNGSQFFIVQNQNVPSNMIQQLEAAGFPEEIIEAYKEGGTPWLDFKHTVFGQVVEGMNVADKMATVKRNSQDKPKEDIIINSVTIEK